MGGVDDDDDCDGCGVWAGVRGTRYGHAVGRLCVVLRAVCASLTRATPGERSDFGESGVWRWIEYNTRQSRSIGYSRRRARNFDDDTESARAPRRHHHLQCNAAIPSYSHPSRRQNAH